MSEKKKMSKKKKIAIIVVSILAFLIVAVVIAGICALNWYCKPKTYEIAKISSSVQDEYDVNLVAHRGFNAVAPENTLPAFEKAGENKFYGAECDIFRTTDGKWVIMHDKNTYRMMDKTANIEKISFKELESYTYDNGTNINDYKNLKICTFEDYLKACKKYNMKAVVELKSKNNTEYYSEVQDLVEKTGMKDDVIFISFYIEDLQAMRKLSDAPMWYLVQKIEDEDIDAALALGGKCGIDFNAAKEENNKEVVKKCIDKGLEMGAWTINDNETLERVYAMGVKTVTTNCITY